MSPDGKAFLREAQSEVTNNWQIKKSTEAGEFVVYEHDEPSYLTITAVANEGRAATGAIQVANTSGFMPFHWSEGGGMQIIGLDLPEEVQRYSNEGTAISADGKVVVGFLPVPPAFRYTSAFRWSSEDGLRWIGRIPANSWSESIAVSGDGSTVVGYESDIGFIWTKNRGLEHFEVPNAETDFSVFKDVSNDGKTSILESFSRRGSSSYVWTESDGFTELQGLGGDRNWVFARDLSGSGSIVVGAGGDADRNSNAVFWNRKNNWAPVNINEFMLSVGHDTKGEFYSTVSNVSDDGQTLLLGAGGSTTRIRLNLSTRDSSTNLVRNGGFEESSFNTKYWGLSRWERSLSKENAYVVNPGYLDKRAARISMGNLAGDPKTLHLRQSGIQLEPNSEYYLSFSVKASLPGKASVQVFKDENPSNNYGVDEEFELTTEWQTHVIEFRTDALGEPVSDGRLQFTFVRGGYKRILEFFVDEVAIHEK